ncbi:MAG: hypothetical protein V1792_07370, partial [Pseudomonadota bacterium]
GRADGSTSVREQDPAIPDVPQLDEQEYPAERGEAGAAEERKVLLVPRLRLGMRVHRALPGL